ncbi:3-carboxy-cis,cis-muconate cycloisomerase [Jannaschia seosinensis]|uniref:3-carboxy-cis,cis-muconate cycloisomerase n=1 Tax=Jannaschia seosinensis TaxID=313367 RepID=A0A0M7B6J7_9RHOB|nr:lyase family protein [Jannaschia seosinensis]CUH16856.1 3-carboxy-cis,cis-muconate cycloisomerase [Jannaschia seosinensis]
MSVTPFDSALQGRAFTDPEIGRLFSDTAELRAMLIVWGALAKAQAAHGLIPETAAAAIHRATLEVQIDPGALARATDENGVVIPALLAAMHHEMKAPEHAQWLHHGATSQDITDTGLALRLRQALTLIAERLDGALDRLAALAKAQAETPMAARTYGQIATPTTFGAVAAIWGNGLLAMRDALPAIRAQVEIVTLGGAAGTLSVMGPAGPQVRAALAEGLALRDPVRSPHAERSHIRALASWLGGALAALDKMAGDLLLLTRDGMVTLGAAGGSSTMPQKANPVAPSRIRALALHGHGLVQTLHAPHADQRDGAAWFAEWLALPQLVAATARALTLAAETKVVPDPARLRAPLDDPTGLIHAEAVSFALDLPRPEAQAQVKEWAAEIRASGGSLIEKAGLPPERFTPASQWGEAPAQARAFAAAVRGD